jgi:hypothetical protein
MTSRKVLSLLMGLLLVLFVSASALAADELYGTWRLISFTRTVIATSKSTDIFGKSPQGFFNFGLCIKDGGTQIDPSGFMASLMEELDYGNFKATLPSSDRLRHDAYY